MMCRYSPSVCALILPTTERYSQYGSALSNCHLSCRDIDPTAFNELVSIEWQGSTPPGAYRFSNDNGFSSANPLDTPDPSYLVGNATQATRSGPTDHGAYFKFGFGSLGPAGFANDSVTFQVLYGVAYTYADARTALFADGASIWSIGECALAFNTSITERVCPFTFYFGFANVGPCLGCAPEPTCPAGNFVGVGQGESLCQ